MGTRADFYIGRGESAEWLGSIAFDGYPHGLPGDLLAPQEREEFRASVAAVLRDREDATLPEEGWPWPWNDSRTTDYAYAWDGGVVWASSFGHAWFRADDAEPDDVCEGGKTAVFPRMDTGRAKRAGERGSGVILVSAHGVRSEGQS